MPAYNASSPPPAVYPGADGFQVFSAERPLSSSSSRQVALAQGAYGKSGLKAFSVEIAFSGAPGAFNFQIQTSDTDADANYGTVPTVGTITTVGSQNTARAEIQTAARFARIFVSSQTANVVNCTATIWNH